MRRFRWSGRRGISIIEVLFSVSILGIVIFVLGSAFYGGLLFIDELRNISVAASAAQEEIERIRSMPFDNLIVMGPTFTTPGFNRLPDPAGSVVADNIHASHNIFRVSVTVSWTSRSGKSSAKSLATLVTRKGIGRQ